MVVRPFHLALLADAWLTVDRPDQALTHLDTALAAARRAGDAQNLVEVHRLRAVAWSRLGRPEADVAAELSTAAAVATAQGTGLFARRVEETAAALGVQVSSHSSAASVRAPV